VTLCHPNRLQPDTIVALATASSAVLRRNAAATELAGRPTDESLDAVSTLGGFALATPREFDGVGANLQTSARVLMALGAGCAATAWVTGTGITSKRFVRLGLQESSLPEIFSNPDAQFCGAGTPHGRAVSVADGVMVTGRWPVVSGCESAAAAVLGVMLSTDGEPEPVYSVVHIPMSELHIELTWDSVGLNGTGSHTVVATDVFVPWAALGMVTPDGRFVVSSSVDILAPLVGAAQGALELTAALFVCNGDEPGGARKGESAAARQLLAEATQLVTRARRSVLAVCADFDSPADDVPLTPLGLSEARLALAMAATDIRGAMDRMLDLHGTRAFSVQSPIQRAWRDISVGTRHPLVRQYPIAEAYSALLTSSASNA
jgi:alkylation response protein AidB-like acyl-CoA dehydrogenase